MKVNEADNWLYKCTAHRPYVTRLIINKTNSLIVQEQIFLYFGIYQAIFQAIGLLLSQLQTTNPLCFVQKEDNDENWVGGRSADGSSYQDKFPL